MLILVVYYSANTVNLYSEKEAGALEFLPHFRNRLEPHKLMSRRDRGSEMKTVNQTRREQAQKQML